MASEWVGVRFVSAGSQDANVDAISPVIVLSGQEFEGVVIYTAGVPTAKSWDYLFFGSRADGKKAIKQLNAGISKDALSVKPLTTNIPTNVTFDPAEPVDGAVDAPLKISMTFPDIMEQTNYFMALGIIQD